MLYSNVIKLSSIRYIHQGGSDPCLVVVVLMTGLKPIYVKLVGPLLISSNIQILSLISLTVTSSNALGIEQISTLIMH